MLSLCRVAAVEKAEAEKVQVVKAAEADAEVHLPPLMSVWPKPRIRSVLSRSTPCLMARDTLSTLWVKSVTCSWLYNSYDASFKGGYMP